MGKLWAITSYYNPASYQRKLQNYRLFKTKLEEQGIPLLTIEVSYDGKFDLDHQENTIFLNGKSILWQKERILNLSENYLPNDCDRVVWLDCDILFESSGWAKATSHLLDEFPLVQPFSEVIRLPIDHTWYQKEGEKWNSFAYIYQSKPQECLFGDFDRHGHSGFAWAARREILNVGLYDACIIGSGDHVMSHAFVGDWDSPCIYRVLGRKGNHLRHFLDWSKRIYPLIRGKVGCLPGRIFHLWHGETVNRKYVSRNKKLYELGFDPYKDIKIGKNGLWEWNSPKEEMHKWMIDYFQERQEDTENVRVS
jgi:hypothetical protein